MGCFPVLEVRQKIMPIPSILGIISFLLHVLDDLLFLFECLHAVEKQSKGIMHKMELNTTRQLVFFTRKDAHWRVEKPVPNPLAYPLSGM